MKIILTILVIFISFGKLYPQNESQTVYSLAWTHNKSANYDSAVYYFRKYLDLDKSDTSQQLYAYKGLSLALLYSFDYSTLVDTLESYLPTIPNAIQDTSITVPKLYTYLALGYYEKGDFTNSYKVYKKAEKLAIQINSPTIITIYSSLISVCLKRSDYKQAQAYALKQLDYLKSKATDLELYEARLDYIFAKVRTETSQQSLNLFHRLLNEGNNIPNSIKKAYIDDIIYHNIAVKYLELDNADSCIYYFNQILPRKNNTLAKIKLFGLFADAYMAKKNQKIANQYIEKSFKLWDQYLTNKKLKNIKQSYTLSKILIKKGMLLQAQSDYQQAAQQFQLTISYYLADYFNEDIYSNPTLELTNSEDALMYAIAYKARALTQLALQSNSQKDRDMAVETYQLAMKLADKMRQQFEAQGSKSFLATRFWWVFEAAIQSCMKLHEATGEEQYKTYAFQFAEKSKAVLVQDAVSESIAEQQGTLPDSLINYEHKLKVDITYIENALFQAEKREKAEKASELRTQLLQKREELRLFALRLKKEFPSYHELKYNQALVNVATIQADLPKHQALVEYFVGDSSIYVFTMTNQDLDVQKMPYTKQIGEQVKQLRKSLDPAAQSMDNSSYNLFIQEAHHLYQQILAPALSKLPQHISKLTFVTDGELSYIPFEVLLTQAADPEIADYRAPDYLIKRYEINYAYSASLLHNKIKSIHQATENGVLAFAPSYPKAVTDSAQSQALGKFRDQVTSLIWNTKEVDQIGAYLPTKSFTNEAATEAQFKELATKYPIIHLAMHALVDDENPMGSRLVFTNSSDSTEDDYLNAYELYNMQLNADLAILSACNTGYGQYVRGEGIVSLGRAFAYAGCPSVVISHWSVDDEATSQLMEGFYQGLADGLDKSTAMRQAKLNYLENTGPREGNPLYWGSFVLIGDDEPISSSFPWSWIIVGVTAVGLGFLGLKKFRKTAA